MKLEAWNLLADRTRTSLVWSSRFALVPALVLTLTLFPSCGSGDETAGNPNAGVETGGPLTTASDCKIVTSGYGPSGGADVRVQKLVTGLTVPWGIAFLSDSEFLVTERPGRVRIVRNGTLAPSPVFVVEDVAAQREGGLLGIALHPQFEANRLFYLYYTARKSGGDVNRVARYRLSNDGNSASLDRVILDNIPSGSFHDGGRIKFGPDGHLYIGTGDGRRPETSQDPNSLGGKILRITADGEVPSSNPIAGNPMFVSGVRNMQAFDWVNSSTLMVADHGPTGDTGRSGHDEVSFVSAGDNLGWPNVWRCDDVQGFKKPFLVFQKAVPPGGLAIYRGKAIPAWQGSAIIASLRSEHLQRIQFTTTGGQARMISHEVHLRGTYGRLREVIEAPDGSLYVTTSNCDSRGKCPRNRDAILRITKN